MKITMWKILFMMWISMDSSVSLASSDFKCGEFEIQGVIRKVDGKNALKLYEGSQSETTLMLDSDLEEVAGLYVDSSVTLRGRLQAPVKNYQGQVESNLSPEEVKALRSSDQPYSARFVRDDIKERIPDPLHPEMDSGMKLIKEMPCGSRGPSSAKKKLKKK